MLRRVGGQKRSRSEEEEDGVDESSSASTPPQYTMVESIPADDEMVVTSLVVARPPEDDLLSTIRRMPPVRLPIPIPIPPPVTPPVVHHHHFHQHQHDVAGGGPPSTEPPLLPPLQERRRHITTPAITDEGDWGEEMEGIPSLNDAAHAAADELAAGPAEWQPIPIPGPEARMRQAARLHPELIPTEPLPPWRCFGCRYQSMGGDMLGRAQTAAAEHAAISEQQWLDLDKLMGSLVAGGNPEDAAAMDVHAYYERLRTRVNGSQRLPGEEELPIWDPMTILYHWTEHLNDPTVWWNDKLRETKEICKMLRTSGLAKQHVATREVEFSVPGLRAYKQMFDIQHMLMKMLPAEAGVGSARSPLSMVDMGARIKVRGRHMYRAHRRQDVGS